MFWGIDYYYIVLVVPALLLSLWAQARVKTAFSTYSLMHTMSGLTGAEAARRILDDNGLNDVSVARVSGNLTDNYNPKDKTVYLSDTVYAAANVAAVGVAAHECGHAVQHQTGYVPMKIRSAIIPVTNIGSTLSVPLIFLGFILGYTPLVQIGLVLFSLMAVFQLVTLPVEFNASRRALATLQQEGMVNADEEAGVKKVLSAAALTYVAALLMSIAQLLRLMLLANRRNNH